MAKRCQYGFISNTVCTRKPEPGKRFCRLHCDTLTLAEKVKATRRRKPDPDGQNKDRARWAGEAIAAFKAETNSDDCDLLKDLLCDLMHWADEEGQDFETALDSAQNHYAAEIGAEFKI